MSDQELSKSIEEKFYPDVVEAGGLNVALEKSFKNLGSSLKVSTLSDVKFIPYAYISNHNRSSQVYLASEKRLFLFDFWSDGVLYANSSNENLLDVAKAIYTWIEKNASIQEMEKTFDFFVAEKQGEIHEDGNYIEYQWISLLQQWKSELEHNLPYSSPYFLIEAAMQQPKLRQLFPFTSLNTLNFSKTTGYPFFTKGFPFARPLKNGKYKVYTRDAENEEEEPIEIGEFVLEEAVEALVKHLPPNCGIAIHGTSEDLEKN